MAEKAHCQTELVYDEQYYLNYGCGPISYTREEPHWLRFFGMIADQILLSLSPKRVLDAGCAMGFLVESLWDRGVEAWGVDISEYAISRVRRDIAPYCRVGSLTDPFPEGKFDLITCIEVLEHIPEEDARKSIGNLTTATDTILFSSTPKDLTEPTHVNVRPIMSWLRLFTEFGFYPDVLFEAQFVSPQAFLLRRDKLPPSDDTLVLFSRLVQQRIETHERDMQIARLEQDLASKASLRGDLQRGKDALQQEINALQQEKDVLQHGKNTLQEEKVSLQREKDALQHELRARLGELTARVNECAAKIEDQAAALHQQSRCQAEISAQLNEHADKIEGQAGTLQQQASFQSQVSLALTRLEADIDRRFLDIVNSRIWRTLVASGALLERLPGLRRKQLGSAPAVDKNPAAFSSVVKPANVRQSSSVQKSDSDLR
jgi:SAM-dependent methyltransferase